jgi:hypothetical protein
MAKRECMRWYLSFVDKVHGKDKFLGACIVEADNYREAIFQAWMLKINPGGEVAIKEVPEEAYYLFPINKLMDRQELEKYGTTYRVGDYKDN